MGRTPMSTKGARMVRITSCHLVGGTLHEHIASVRWVNPADKETGQSSRTEMVSWIENTNGRAIVGEGPNQVDVGVVDATPKYIRTHADGKWTNNLLSLPRY
jgi:hypothetical protein